MPSRTTSAGTVEKPKTPARMWTWKKHAESTLTLVSDDHDFKKGTEEPVEIQDTAPRLAALRKKMIEENLDYL